MNDLQARAESLLPEHLGLLGELASIDTGTGQAEGILQAGEILVRRLAGLGFTIEAIPAGEYGRHLLARRAGRGQPLLFLGHLDTVFPPGTARQPQEIGEYLAGPGVYDCKGGLVVFLLACRLWEQGGWPAAPLTVLINADEEVGSLSSRPTIEAEAGKSRAALVVEPAPGRNQLITARRGIGRYLLRVFGRAAHSGADRSAGINAIVELSAKILALESLNAGNGISVTVGTVAGGVRPNVVPEYAQAEIDLRLTAPEQMITAEAAIRQAVTVSQVAGATYHLTGGITRPPMPESEGGRRLFAQAAQAARDLGLSLSAASTGGGSDGNFCAALGVPTLDGLGPEGGGAHAEREQILVSSLALRGALLAELGRRLGEAD